MKKEEFKAGIAFKVTGADNIVYSVYTIGTTGELFLSITNNSLTAFVSEIKLRGVKFLVRVLNQVVLVYVPFDEMTLIQENQ